MITIILAILLVLVWIAGAIIVSVLTGWEAHNNKDLVKIIFWPISVFIAGK